MDKLLFDDLYNKKDIDSILEQSEYGTTLTSEQNKRIKELGKEKSLQKLLNKFFDDLLKKGQISTILQLSDNGDLLSKEQLKKVKDEGKKQSEQKLLEKNIEVSKQPGYKEFLLSEVYKKMKFASSKIESKEKKESLKEAVSNIPLLGNIVKEKKQNQQVNENIEKDSSNQKIEILNKNTLLLTQISDNIYNIAAQLGAQLTSTKEVENALQEQTKLDAEKQKIEPVSKKDAEPANTKKVRSKIVGTAKGDFIASALFFGLSIIDDLVKFFKNPIDTISKLLSSLGEGIVEFFTESGFQNFILEAFETGKKELVEVWENIKNVFTVLIGNPIANLIDNIKLAFIDMSSKGLDILPDWAKNDSIKNIQKSLTEKRSEIEKAQQQRAEESEKIKQKLEKKSEKKEVTLQLETPVPAPVPEPAPAPAPEPAPAPPPVQEPEPVSVPVPPPVSVPTSVLRTETGAVVTTGTGEAVISGVPPPTPAPVPPPTPAPVPPPTPAPVPPPVPVPFVSPPPSPVAVPAPTPAQVAKPEKIQGAPSGEPLVKKISASVGKEAMLKEMDRQNITDPIKRAAIMAQAAKETGGFQFLSENLGYSASGLKKTFGRLANTPMETIEAAVKGGAAAIGELIYGGSKDSPSFQFGLKNLGNKNTGDGALFRGRGFFQLTGRSNYERAGAADNPQKLLNTDEAAKTAVDFALRFKGDFSDVVAFTKYVNGGTIGLEERKKYYEQFLNDPTITQVGKVASQVSPTPTSGSNIVAMSSDVSAAKKQQQGTTVVVNNINNSSSTAVKVGAPRGGSTTIPKAAATA